MVFYVRFLKPPRLDVSKGVVRALVTVTTDLGDDFYPGALTLFARVVTPSCERHWQSRWQRIEWKTGLRTLWIEIRNMEHCPPEPLQLVISTQPTLMADDVFFPNIPEVLSVRSDLFGRGNGWKKPQADNRVERRYRTNGGNERMVWEETGESIARHIWDAGITLASYLSYIVSQPKPTSSLAEVLKHSERHVPRIIELGSGCGIVGLEVAHISATSDVLLTDLADAMDILKFNVAKARHASKCGKVATAVLDWDDALPDEVSELGYDVIIVSDCTYNTDSIPALVRTLVALVERSPAALIVVSMKVRHDSEAIFFDIMANAELAEIDHIKASLPDQRRRETGQSLEMVDVYIYGRKGPAGQWLHAANGEDLLQSEMKRTI